MFYVRKYKCSLGNIILVTDEIGLCGVWFEGQRNYILSDKYIESNNEFILLTKKLNIYFQGRIPNFNVPLHLLGSEFQIKVWKILITIPYGNYKDITLQIYG